MVRSPTLPAQRAQARTNTHRRKDTHTKKTWEFSYFTFFLGGIVVKPVPEAYSALVTTGSNHRSPGSSEWDDKYAMEVVYL